ncbi:2-succinyl-5-enolpyruvyl-6-hydroxy-3-cyclohexene-1-carboxylic-acid synthase [Bogoriella caseilytica]|uniref:2-succinyl-5-enolpyruvyl-6-hydroxy-3-cyclohexene-1-carboxylate synthase n=1 Tax=Bogoriella caseilytica TaxID=56055 RepID=A0A3N2BAM3_9MICO|nr:2-succinyl-5-enolpyruvyl-6-hydroxy-3-cyclohexene-1-carboxylic-acid synthase [Bogoriella caseilytica]ROR72321.1 2-succinyl-5-enolpyruvyl-6-hydroxy-3-cyclohexene-1-carboxylate synthase [Bogoriella caseilytica]
MTTTDSVEPSAATARLLVTTLVAQGVRDVVLAPGSRSAPFAYAAHEAEQAGWWRLHVRLDERGAGFFALGLARATGQPVPVITTSGTAVANLHPAVLEAAHAGVPLVVVSADRPHEWRGTGANQTTDQVRLFSSAVRFDADIPAGVPAGRGLAQIVTRALAAARGVRSAHPGPVQLNVSFADPLTPAHAWQPGPRPEVHEVVSPLSSPSAAPISPGPRTVVVAGDGAGPAARSLAEQGRWPVLAEPTSGARAGECAIGPYRLLLDVPELAARVQRVIVTGRPTLSRPVSALLARTDVEVVVVSPGGLWPDVAGSAERVLPAVRAAGLPSAADEEWLALWKRAGTAVEAALDEHVSGRPLEGLGVAREIWRAGGAEALMIGSSNPIRDLDLAATPGESAPARVLANRGLAGIDGTIATATGLAQGFASPVRAYLGDLTFLHDASSLMRGRLEAESDLQVVVLDDSGGGIFATLEHGEAGRAAHFARLFGTPQDVDMAALAGAYGVRYTRVANSGELRAALAAPLRGRSLVHIPVDGSALRESRRELEAASRAAVRASL